MHMFKCNCKPHSLTILTHTHNNSHTRSTNTDAHTTYNEIPMLLMCFLLNNSNHVSINDHIT